MPHIVKSKIRTIPHWPKQGVMFRDITTLLKDTEGLKHLIELLVERYKDTANEIPVNPDKPGEYQWEAVTDEAAKEIIEEAISEHIDLALIDEVKEETEDQENEWEEKIKDVVQELVDEYFEG